MTEQVEQVARVERDARGLRTTFDEFEVGASLGSMEWTVYPENVQGLLDNDDDHHPWYTENSPFGAPIVPPMATYPPVRLLFLHKYNVRGLFYIYESEFIKPMFYGQKITISGKICDKWIKRDREYVMYEAEGVNEEGAIVFRTKRAHALDYIPRTAPRAGIGVDSGLATKSNSGGEV